MFLFIFLPVFLVFVPCFAGVVCVVSAAMCSGVFLVVFRFIYSLLVGCLCFFVFLCLLLFLQSVC